MVPKAKVKTLKAKNIKSLKSRVTPEPKRSPNAKKATGKRKMSKRGKLTMALKKVGRTY